MAICLKNNIEDDMLASPEGYLIHSIAIKGTKYRDNTSLQGYLIHSIAIEGTKYRETNTSPEGYQIPSINIEGTIHLNLIQILRL